MFSRFNQLIFGGLGIIILGLGLWLWRQSSEIEGLRVTNQSQAQTISELESVQQRLEFALKQEQQAVENQQKIANQLKQQAESKREKVRVIFKDNPCANTALPRGIVEQLQ